MKKAEEHEKEESSPKSDSSSACWRKRAENFARERKRDRRNIYNQRVRLFPRILRSNVTPGGKISRVSLTRAAWRTKPDKVALILIETRVPSAQHNLKKLRNV